MSPLLSPLFSPVRIGRLELRNRVVMAPMTRSRAHRDGVPAELAATYYRQRSGAGLIISEGTAPSALGKGYLHMPGIYTDAQVEGWRRITDAVHAGGGLIALQLMHTGRIAHASLLPGGAAPVAPSAIRAAGSIHTDSGLQPFDLPRALTAAEVPGVVGEYRAAAARALEAGFDGIELHAASGYLPEQFLASGTNMRNDRYGGPVENRCRFIIEVMTAMAEVAGADRLGIKLSPEADFNDIRDERPSETYGHLVRELDRLGLGWLHVVVPSAATMTKAAYHRDFRRAWRGAYLIGGGLDHAAAVAHLTGGDADAVVFGKWFLANPDLPERLRRGAALNEPQRRSFYTQGAEGYVDYPSLT